MSAIELLQEIRAGFFRETQSALIESKRDVEVFADAVAANAVEGFRVTMDGGAMTTTYTGREGFVSGWTDFAAPFEEIRIEPEEIIESPTGDCVVEFVRMTGRPRGTDAAIEHESAAVWRVQEGRLTEVEFHMSRGAALRSGGIAAGEGGA